MMSPSIRGALPISNFRKKLGIRTGKIILPLQEGLGTPKLV